jgi:UDP-glucose 4-epimerase
MTMIETEKWLITGGAGYIGAHLVDQLLQDGKEVVVYDSLVSSSTSRLKFLESKHKKRIPFVRGDIRNRNLLGETIKRENISGIMHTAALKSVRESFEKPNEYMDVNFYGTEQVIDSAETHDVKKFIFSSTAAVYSQPIDFEQVSESADTHPVTPYGISKLKAEKVVTDFLKHPDRFGTNLRFFNVVGCASPLLADKSIQNLVPIIIHAIQEDKPIRVFGNDYETPDGTCIRDYIDVRDLANAHILISKIEKSLPAVLNVGNGLGMSVTEVVKLTCKLLESENHQVIVETRRLGDSPCLVANNAFAKKLLGFKAEFDLEESIRSQIF